MQYYLCCCTIPVSPIPTLRTMILSDLQSLTDSSKAVGAGLARAVGIDFGKVHPTLPTDPFCQRQELSKCCIYAVFSQYPSRQTLNIEVFGKDSLRLVAQLMCRFQVKVFATLSNAMVDGGYFRLCFLPVLRTFLRNLRLST